MSLEGYIVQTGKYQHYKGQFYDVLGVARHSEDESEFVVYRTCYGNYDLWIRPRSMFEENVVVDGKVVPRFRYVGEGQ